MIPTNRISGTARRPSAAWGRDPSRHTKRRAAGKQVPFRHRLAGHNPTPVKRRLPQFRSGSCGVVKPATRKNGHPCLASACLTLDFPVHFRHADRICCRFKFFCKREPSIPWRCSLRSLQLLWLLGQQLDLFSPGLQRRSIPFPVRTVPDFQMVSRPKQDNIFSGRSLFQLVVRQQDSALVIPLQLFGKSVMQMIKLKLSLAGRQSLWGAVCHGFVNLLRVQPKLSVVSSYDKEGGAISVGQHLLPDGRWDQEPVLYINRKSVLSVQDKRHKLFPTNPYL